ncbi:hypothetical protein BDZ89DRAFT_1124959 [Hymenopellis radicata]|nr:hypothetical protein BDZ89DRAFT_1124959 [Hymenopellis radicata]
MTAPRWQRCIATALAEHEKATILQFASIDPTTPIPHVRSLVFRGFTHPSNDPNLPLLIMTTDSRTPKTSQIISNPHVQLAWWIEGTKEQFRIGGLASVIPAPTNGLYKHFLHSTKSALENSGICSLNKEGFDWEKKRNEVFRGMSPVMKASWVRPVPGTPLVGGEEEANKWPVKLKEPDQNGIFDSEESKRLWELALSNFALVVVDPIDVDYVELAPIPNRRARFWKDESGQWQEEALVP